jgi:hypothetical protein
VENSKRCVLLNGLYEAGFMQMRARDTHKCEGFISLIYIYFLHKNNKIPTGSSTKMLC